MKAIHFLVSAALTLNVLLAVRTPIQAQANDAQNAATVQNRNWDFENGLHGWTSTGTAFDAQPAGGDEIQTGRPAKLVKVGGDYWRNLPYSVGQHGRSLILTEDASIGTLTSAEFTIDAATPYLNFLIGGSDDLAHERLELQILCTSREDADEIERHLRTLPVGGSMPTRDGDYLTVLKATGRKGPDGLTLDVLQSRTILLPDFLFGRIARLKIIDDSSEGHISVDFIRFTREPSVYRGKVWGYADYHTHPNTNLAFGGLKGVKALWGDPGGAYSDYENGTKRIADDIPHCVKGHGGGPTAEVFINQTEERVHLGGLFASIWDYLRGRLTRHKRSGGPEFANFPSFLSGAHQQMHITQIRRNYDGGLRLMVAIATNNRGAEYLVSKVDKDGTIATPTTDRDVVDAEIREMRQLAKLNQDWMEIAFTPDDARRIIGDNKLAVILGIEVDQTGELDSSNPEMPASEVKYLWDLGIREVIPIHGSDNRLGGAAVFIDPYNWLNDFLHRRQYNLSVKDLPNVPATFFQVRDGSCNGPLSEQRGECVFLKLANPQRRLVIKKIPLLGLGPFPEPFPAPMYDQFKGHKNLNGLTSTGRAYIEALMNRGMIIDTAHMSDLSLRDVYDVIGAKLRQGRSDCDGFSLEADYSKIPQPCFAAAYPTIVSHVHFRALSFYDEKTLVTQSIPSEYQISNRNVQMVQRVGGVLGPFVTEKPLSLPPEQSKAPFDNDCSGSSKGFGYSFRYGLQNMNGRGVGMATDFIFIPAVSPRFGRNACWAFNLAPKPSAELSLNPRLYDRQSQRNGVVYTDVIKRNPKVKYGTNEPLIPYRMGQRWFDFNVEGLAHFGLVPDMLQDLKNVGMSRDDFAALFSSAESYLQMWEKTWRVAQNPGAPGIR